MQKQQTEIIRKLFAQLDAANAEKIELLAQNKALIEDNARIRSILFDAINYTPEQPAKPSEPIEAPEESEKEAKDRENELKELTGIDVGNLYEPKGDRP